MSKRTLLLADDSVTIQKVVNLTFADEGIDVVTVGDGDSAVEKISEIAPDILLLDVHMPGLSGYQICEMVRANPETKDLPVILLVGSFEPFDENEAARVGANAFLTKPFQSIRQLVSQVTDLIEATVQDSRAQPAAEESVEVAPAEEPFEESRAAETPSPNPPATEDIDSLYDRSFSEPSPDETDLDSGAPRYVDAGMDDEMIETSSFERPFDDVGPAADPSHEENGQSEYQAAEPVPEFEENERPDYLEQDTIGAPESKEVDYSAPTSEFQFMETDEPQHEAAAPESRFEDPYEIGAAVADATAGAFSEFDEVSRTEQIPVFEPAPESSGFGLDDVDLLDLPPIENGKSPDVPAAQHGSSEVNNKQVVSLSPELMDLIVQKVVEKLADKK
ncbi:MAG: response regulator [Pyrinomonadaceae bacterium]